MAGIIDMRFIAPIVCDIFGLRKPNKSEMGALEELVVSIGNPKFLIVVVFDGFGTAALSKLSTACPNFNSLRNLHFREIRAVTPPKTPVNFATMATGASQKGHGIDAKTDPLRMETVFHVFAESGLSTCVAGRESGSPANLFHRFADYLAIARSNMDLEVLQLLLEIMEQSRPAFTLVQFLDIDNAGHRTGPFSQESWDAIRGTDEKLGRVMEAVSNEDGAVIVLSDHGQHEISVEEDGLQKKKGRHDGTSRQDFSAPLTWCSAEELALLLRRAQ